MGTERAELQSRLLVRASQAWEVCEELVTFEAACDLEQPPPLQAPLLLAQRLARLAGRLRSARRHVGTQSDVADVVEGDVARALNLEPTKGGVDGDESLVLDRVQPSCGLSHHLERLRARQHWRRLPTARSPDRLDVELAECGDVARADEGE